MTNPELITAYLPLISAISANLIGQTIKIITELTKQKSFRVKTLFVSGGMPSSHTALISAISTTFALQEGLNSPHFLISFCLLAIVAYDAMGVRLMAGKQADAFNKLLDTLPPEQTKNIQKIQPQKGHTLAEVLTGILLGISTSLIIVYNWS